MLTGSLRIIPAFRSYFVGAVDRRRVMIVGNGQLKTEELVRTLSDLLGAAD
jgi:hypothetical protein